ncbi:protein-glutamate methylesterase/protein-glutamine glutaminase [Polycladidibacter stylochi]|uniref:protein-glutamate methylesterase/protein-glutamine glutaminase n=1 Tax=Polycladidibacter stylochi TaxID=1807766 RepID=UPI000831F88C|nr:chemotaxis response regulator protein-glutamate methylesterase [Pseudovibrio stylochi]
MLESKKASTGGDAAPIRVMIVDDSVVIRGLFSRWIGEEPELSVVATFRNGQLAVDGLEQAAPDVVVLDIEMPVMDGLTALPLLLKKQPDLTVVMASTLTHRNAAVSLRALSLGATDYVGKPETTAQTSTSLEFRRELIEKLKGLGRIKGRRAEKRRALQSSRRMRVETSAGQKTQQSTAASPVRASRIDARQALQMAKARAEAEGPNFTTRPYGRTVPRIVAIGSSTGGPQALLKVLGDMKGAISRVPVVITQHMPRTFTTILAEHLQKSVGVPAKEAENDELLQNGVIYVAPGGIHLSVAQSAHGVVARLSDSAPINFCRPSVEPLFQSVAEVYGSSSLALMLTGMGADGAEGVNHIAAQGGAIIAQDEYSSVVWGMPGAAARTGNCNEVLPLDQIGGRVSGILEGALR